MCHSNVKLQGVLTVLGSGDHTPCFLRVSSETWMKMGHTYHEGSYLRAMLVFIRPVVSLVSLGKLCQCCLSFVMMVLIIAN